MQHLNYDVNSHKIVVTSQLSLCSDTEVLTQQWQHTPEHSHSKNLMNFLIGVIKVYVLKNELHCYNAILY